MLGSPQQLVQNSPEGFWWGLWMRILPTISVRSWQHYKNQHSSHQTRIPSGMSCWLFQTEGSQTSSTRRWMIYTHEVTISITATLTSPNQGFVCLFVGHFQWRAGSISSLSSFPLTWEEAKVLTAERAPRAEEKLPPLGEFAKFKTEKEKATLWRSSIGEQFHCPPKCDPGDLCCQSWDGHHHGQLQAQPPTLSAPIPAPGAAFAQHFNRFSLLRRVGPSQICTGKELSTKTGAAAMWTETKWPLLPNSWSQSVRVYFFFFLLLRLSVCFMLVWATSHNFNSFNQRVMIISDTVDDEQITAKM